MDETKSGRSKSSSTDKNEIGDVDGVVSLNMVGSLAKMNMLMECPLEKMCMILSFRTDLPYHVVYNIITYCGHEKHRKNLPKGVLLYHDDVRAFQKL